MNYDITACKNCMKITKTTKDHKSENSGVVKESVPLQDRTSQVRSDINNSLKNRRKTMKPIDKAAFTAFVYDNGSDDIKITMCYCVGTTDNCVVKGNVTSGEFAYTNDISIAASEISDVSKRAGLLFDGLYKAFVDVEGK